MNLGPTRPQPGESWRVLTSGSSHPGVTVTSLFIKTTKGALARSTPMLLPSPKYRLMLRRTVRHGPGRDAKRARSLSRLPLSTRTISYLCPAVCSHSE